MACAIWFVDLTIIVIVISQFAFSSQLSEGIQNYKNSSLKYSRMKYLLLEIFSLIMACLGGDELV